MTTLFIKKTGCGYPLVLLHGWAFTHAIWQPIEAALSSRYTIYAVDLPGLGQSSLMDWETFKQQLFLQVATPCAVLGWSLGGLYAMRLAIEASDAITHLISVASSPCFVEKPHWPGIPAARFEQFHHHLKTDPKKCIQDFVKLQAGDIALDYLHTKQSSGLLQGLDDLMHWDFSPQLQYYAKPAHFIFGRRDAIVPASLMSVMQRMHPNFTYHMIPKAAHMPFLSHHDLFIEIIIEALSLGAVHRA